MTAYESHALIRFPDEDEPFPKDKALQRELIEQQVQAYLAKGGVIEIVDPKESAAKHYPIRPTRRVLVNFLRRKSYLNHRGKGSNDQA